ncbi:MAG: hypothetical protein AAFY82_04450 [Pseudomonadota bacterium]
MTELLVGPGYKPAFSAIALVLNFVAFLPYYRDILGDVVKPHVFSWGIWSAGTLIIFFAQLSDGAGIGAWPIGVSGLLTGGVALLALTRAADTSIARMDYVFLILAASALPLWFLSSSALSAVIILTLVDLLGFGPSARKAYAMPNEESVTFFAIGAIRNVLIVMALEHVSWTTALFPAAVGLACCGFVGLILIRRQMVPQELVPGAEALKDLV